MPHGAARGNEMHVEVYRCTVLPQACGPCILQMSKSRNHHLGLYKRRASFAWIIFSMFDLMSQQSTVIPSLNMFAMPSNKVMDIQYPLSNTNRDNYMMQNANVYNTSTYGYSAPFDFVAALHSNEEIVRYMKLETPQKIKLYCRYNRCPEKDKKFTSYELLAEHMNIHSRDFNFMPSIVCDGKHLYANNCPFTVLGFSRENERKEHKQHRQCERCKKLFSRVDNLKTHITAKGGKPSPCQKRILKLTQEFGRKEKTPESGFTSPVLNTSRPASSPLSNGSKSKSPVKASKQARNVPKNRKLRHKFSAKDVEAFGSPFKPNYNPFNVVSEELFPPNGEETQNMTVRHNSDTVSIDFPAFDMGNNQIAPLSNFNQKPLSQFYFPLIQDPLAQNDPSEPLNSLVNFNIDEDLFNTQNCLINYSQQGLNHHYLRPSSQLHQFSQSTLSDSPDFAIVDMESVITSFQTNPLTNETPNPSTNIFL